MDDTGCLMDGCHCHPCHHYKDKEIFQPREGFIFFLISNLKVRGFEYITSNKYKELITGPKIYCLMLTESYYNVLWEVSKDMHVNGLFSLVLGLLLNHNHKNQIL